ncbi:hypothetical protein ADICEAN_02105 [Cesiribacter andamanensis AMV16]|uniref:Uncharacterized protein n=1 Tax=Cesiribacter andamanensis AMV16 TaxID=1279009 RepID=M7N689_9BACT|nr:hypothetical protein ADICEAN_02105 [Cesiribacter andamanensis AMV16]
MPEQNVDIKQGEENKPQLPAQKKVLGRGAIGLAAAAVHEQENAGPKEQRKQGPLGAFKNPVNAKPELEIEPGFAKDGRIVPIGSGKSRNVHEQNAQQGNAAQTIQNIDPLAGAGRGRLLFCGRG